MHPQFAPRAPEPDPSEPSHFDILHPLVTRLFEDGRQAAHDSWAETIGDRARYVSIASMIETAYAKSSPQKDRRVPVAVAAQ